MEEKNVTITVSEYEMELILRSIKARVNHWSTPEKINRVSNAKGIRIMYRTVLEKVEHQVESQLEND